MLKMIPVPNEAIMKPKELSVKPKSTVKKVCPSIKRAPAPKRLSDIETVMFLISLLPKILGDSSKFLPSYTSNNPTSFKIFLSALLAISSISEKLILVSKMFI